MTRSVVRSGKVCRVHITGMLCCILIVSQIVNEFNRRQDIYFLRWADDSWTWTAFSAKKKYSDLSRDFSEDLSGDLS